MTEQGDTGAVDVAETSGSRMLDRAAVNAVRSWRFRPAMRGGWPAADVVMVPITFNPTQ
ncbi:energy transducer TonB [Lysobacter sp. 2RAB21]